MCHVAIMLEASNGYDPVFFFFWREAMAAPLSLQPIALPPSSHRIPPPAGKLIFALPHLRPPPIRHAIGTHAKFDKFDGRVEQEPPPTTPPELRLPQLQSQLNNQEEEEEDDDR